MLTGNQQPDHSRISDFRRRNLDALKGLFVQILRLCQTAGMVSLGPEALDGTKVNANASKHKAMSHERMLRAEKQLAQEISALMRKAEILDAQEEADQVRAQADAAKQAEVPAAEPAELHRCRQPSDEVRRPRHPGLQRPGGCRQRPPGDRGGGREQPSPRRRTSGAHTAAHRSDSRLSG